MTSALTSTNSGPGLFGLRDSNRDFTKPKFWGKNQFNSSFPASLACYFGYRNLQPIYLTLDTNLKIAHHKIDVLDLFGLRPIASSGTYDYQTTPNLHFNFESVFVPHALFAIGQVPRVDLITQSSRDRTHLLRALEVKLTALPDNQTYALTEDKYGCELVVRPDTIVYLALNIAALYQTEQSLLLSILNPVCTAIANWQDAAQVYPLLRAMCAALDNVLQLKLSQQSPLLMQPIWKTRGKTQILADDCFDLFVWSDFGFTRLFMDITKRTSAPVITRSARSVVWLTKMLYDFSRAGKFEHKTIIDTLTYNTRNDKAFAIGGVGTNPYMASAALVKPRLPKEALRDIILGGGQYFLSPERRLDAAIMNSRMFPDPPTGTIMPPAPDVEGLER